MDAEPVCDLLVTHAVRNEGQNRALPIGDRAGHPGQRYEEAQLGIVRCVSLLAVTICQPANRTKQYSVLHRGAEVGVRAARKRGSSLLPLSRFESRIAVPDRSGAGLADHKHGRLGAACARLLDRVRLAGRLQHVCSKNDHVRLAVPTGAQKVVAVGGLANHLDSAGDKQGRQSLPEERSAIRNHGE